MKKNNEINKILNKIPASMKKIDLSIEEITDLDSLVEEEYERNFVLNTLACILTSNLDRLNKLNELERKYLEEFINFYKLGEVIYKNIGYKINWTKNISEIRDAYYLELERITYYDLDYDEIRNNIKLMINKEDTYYNNLISDDFKKYLKRVTGKELLDSFPKKMYYNIEQSLKEYGYSVNIQRIIEEKKSFALLLIYFRYPLSTIMKLTDLDMDTLRDLKIFSMFMQNDVIDSKNLIRKKR